MLVKDLYFAHIYSNHSFTDTMKSREWLWKLRNFLIHMNNMAAIDHQNKLGLMYRYLLISISCPKQLQCVGSQGVSAILANFTLF